MGILSFTWIIIGGGVAEKACTCSVTSMMILLIEQTTAVAMMDGIVYRMMIALIIIRAEHISVSYVCMLRCSTFNEPICTVITWRHHRSKFQPEKWVWHHRSQANSLACHEQLEGPNNQWARQQNNTGIKNWLRPTIISYARKGNLDCVYVEYVGRVLPHVTG